MQLGDVTWTDLFVGDEWDPLQIVRVTVVNQGPGMARESEAVTVRVEGPGVTTPEPVRVRDLAPGAEHVIEVPVAVDPAFGEGTSRPVAAVAETAATRVSVPAEIEVAAPGWTMLMVSHFHYDPVWWNTQASFTEAWYDVPEAEAARLPEMRTAFDLVRAHLAAARNDPDYKFVLAEVDYLKPHWDAFPEDREDLRRLIAEGRVEIVGGGYNEPNTNLTCTESTIRSAVYGIGFQRDVIGGDPRSAWMLDVFGHDPSYPGLMAEAGLTASAWARGPFHQWGPKATMGDNRRMQFPSEFEWISPSGRGLLTSYMPDHYTAGWSMESLKTLEQAEDEAYRLFRDLKEVAATRWTMLPVGNDHVIPSRWCTEIHRDWNKRYLWPRFQVGLPREFFAAVRQDAAERGIAFTPQSRDMNPVYTGKDVSYIDTKQAQRAAEVAVLEGERLATLAALLGARFPAEALDKAWRQLLFNAHHDAITGTESDQVYLDLLGGWREAHELGDTVREAAIEHIGGRVDTAEVLTRGGPGRPVLVVNTLSWPRDGLARVRLVLPEGETPGIELRDDEGAPVPALAEGERHHPDGSLAEVTLSFRARSVPALGYRTIRAVPAGTLPGGWSAADGPAIENERFRVEADPERGGALAGILDKRAGKQLLRPGAAGNELVVYEEYEAHPAWAEGPWHVLPKGPGRGSAALAGEVRAERCPIGRRLVSTWTLDELRVRQEVLLWDGIERVDFRAEVDGSIGHDRLLRVRFPLDVAGALPVYEVGNAVVGRPSGFPDEDSAAHPWTLDNPASTWFGLGSTARVALRSEGTEMASPDGEPRALVAIGVAEVVAADAESEAVRELVARLAGSGVTATCTRPEGPRYGSLDLDSNLPDVRIALGDPERNAFVAGMLEQAERSYAERLRDELARHGSARVWVPAARPREQTWVPSADVRGPRDLPVLIVAGNDLEAAIEALAADLDDSTIEVTQPATMDGTTTPLEDYSVALLNRGTPGCVAEAGGTLSISLMRSCSGWPAGVWLDPPRRTVPDGSSFAWQHWSHTFHYALVAGDGDWRRAGFVTAGQAFNHDLHARVAGAHDGDLPSSASMFHVEPKEVLLTALKLRGNPLASGLPGDVDPVAAGVALRCFESTGRPAQARVRSFTGLADGRATDLLEQRERGAVAVEDGALTFPIGAADTLTVTVLPATPPPSRAAAGPSGPRAEPAQPVFTRYWLHNKGPAPIGNVPVSVHISPTASVLSKAETAVALRVTVASGARATAGRAELLVPTGLAVEPASELAYDLAPGAHAGFDLAVRARPGVPSGRYFLAAQIGDDLGQTLEDVAAITVGEAGPEREEPLAVALETSALNLAPGERAEVLVRLENRARSEIRGEAQLVSPYGSWELLAPWTQGFAVRPGTAHTLRYTVQAPATARPGSHWWALVKVMYFGRLAYTEAVPITITAG